MSKRKKSLADELAALYNPAPTDHDPDALELGDGARLASDDDHEEPQGRPSRRAPEKAMLLRGDIVLDDAAYRGRKTSRAAVFGDDGEGDLGSDDDTDVELELGERESDEEGQEAAAKRARAALAQLNKRPPHARTTGGTKQPGAPSTTPRSQHANMDAGYKEDREGEDLEDEEEAEDGGEDEGADDSEDQEEEGEEEDEEDGAARTGATSGSDADLTGDGQDSDDEDLDNAAAAPAASQRAARPSSAAGDGELDEFEAEYEALQLEGERQLAALRQKSERDQIKGAAVKNQQVLYERALEQRILLQKCLQASNGLPRPDTHAALVRVQPEARESYSHLAVAARNTLAQLLELQRTLMGRIPGVTLPAMSGELPAGDTAAPADRPTVSGRPKRGREEATAGDNSGSDHGPDRDAAAAGGGAEGDGEPLDLLWQRLNAHHECLGPYRDASLDSWHRRTVLSSGSGALRNSGLRALNQSVSSQVQALMRDPEKFIKRTRLTVATCPRVLCEPLRAGPASADPLHPNAHADGAAPNAPLGQHTTGTAGGAGTGPGGSHGTSTSVAVDVIEDERDAETYDDSEFYQQLLKEFLDKGLAQGPSAGAPKAVRKRKLVDRRASKGRKLRYHVQEKLVAFMAPVDFEPPSFAANLFSNLFGHAGQ